jgi:hypothetical protein
VMDLVSVFTPSSLKAPFFWISISWFLPIWASSPPFVFPPHCVHSPVVSFSNTLFSVPRFHHNACSLGAELIWYLLWNFGIYCNAKHLS